MSYSRKALTLLSPDEITKYVRPEVIRFACIMEYKLRENEYKPGWQHDNELDLILRADEKLSNLYTELVSAERNPLRIGDRAANVANFCMMIADNMGALKKE